MQWMSYTQTLAWQSENMPDYLPLEKDSSNFYTSNSQELIKLANWSLGF